MKTGYVQSGSKIMLRSLLNRSTSDHQDCNNADFFENVTGP